MCLAAEGTSPRYHVHQTFFLPEAAFVGHTGLSRDLGVGNLLMCFSPPYGMTRTQIQNFCHPPTPATIPGIFFCLCVFLSLTMLFLLGIWGVQLSTVSLHCSRRGGRGRCLVVLTIPNDSSATVDNIKRTPQQEEQVGVLLSSKFKLLFFSSPAHRVWRTPARLLSRVHDLGASNRSVCPRLSITSVLQPKLFGDQAGRRHLQ